MSAGLGTEPGYSLSLIVNRVKLAEYVIRKHILPKYPNRYWNRMRSYKFFWINKRKVKESSLSGFVTASVEFPQLFHVVISWSVDVMDLNSYFKSRRAKTDRKSNLKLQNMPLYLRSILSVKEWMIAFTILVK